MTKLMLKGALVFIFLIIFLVLDPHPAPARASGEAATLNNSDRFYGKNILSPLLEKDKPIMHLPGDTRVEIEDSQTNYVIVDHLRSSRVAMTAANTISEQIDYTPFGDSQTIKKEGAWAGYYTGISLDSETDTYDYHARWYDPSVGRFTDVDAARESASPYSYAGNNPIVYLDPTGLVRTTFFVQSGMSDTGYYHMNPKNVAEELGKIDTKNVYDADKLFGKEKSQTWERFKMNLGGLRTANDQLVWLIADDSPAPKYLKQRLKDIRSEWRGFADNITIFNFSQTNSRAHEKINTALENIFHKSPTIFHFPVLDVGNNKKQNFRQSTLLMNDKAVTLSEFGKQIRMHQYILPLLPEPTPPSSPSPSPLPSPLSPPPLPSPQTLNTETTIDTGGATGLFNIGDAVQQPIIEPYRDRSRSPLRTLPLWSRTPSPPRYSPTGTPLPNTALEFSDLLHDIHVSLHGEW